MNIPRDVDAVIVGGGISGLCVAYWLKKSGAKVLVLEKEPEVGGTMKSIRDQGFLIETGPTSALETTPLFRELVRACGIEDQFVYASPAGRNRYILRNGTLHALPLNPVAFVRSRLFSPAGKLRLLMEPFVGRASKEESIAEFVTRRVGREFLDYAIDPFVAGVFAGRPERLSVRAAFPKLYALEEKYGGLVKGMVLGRRERKRRGEVGKDRAESFSFLEGMQTLPRALAAALQGSVLTNTTVTSLQRTAGSLYSLQFTNDIAAAEVRGRVVILSTPAYIASEILRQYSKETAQRLDSIPYSPVVSLFLGIRREDVGIPLDGFGLLVPSKEQRRILGCLWSSSLFPARAPEGMVALTAFVGGARQPELTELSDERLCDLVLSELKNCMQLSGKLVYWNVTRWKRAIPQYELGHLQIIESLQRFEQNNPGLFLCSNYKGGISVGDCVKNAREIALRAEAHLQTPSTPSPRS